MIKKLLLADLTKRYGCLKAGADDIKKHKWFSDMNWDNLVGRKLQAPILPQVSGASDTSNFDPYPDSVEEAPIPIYSGNDPFVDF